MKKFLTLITAFILALSMLCADSMAAPEPEDIIGSWYLNAIETQGIVMSPTMWEMTMIINEDNTLFLQAPEIGDMAGTWSIADGQITVSTDGREYLVFTLADGKLSAEQNGTKILFGKEKIDFIDTVRSDASLLDFNGTWSAYFAVSAGSKMPIDASKNKYGLVIEDGKAIITLFGTSIQLEGEVSAGILTMTWVNATGKAIPISFKLHEDGTVSGTCGESEETITFYYQKVDE